MTTEATVNLNNSQCLQSITNFGETIIRNICNGKSVTVPWGTMDYVAVIGLCLICLLVAAMFVRMAYNIWTGEL